MLPLILKIIMMIRLPKHFAICIMFHYFIVIPLTCIFKNAPVSRITYPLLLGILTNLSCNFFNK